MAPKYCLYVVLCMGWILCSIINASRGSEVTSDEVASKEDANKVFEDMEKRLKTLTKTFMKMAMPHVYGQVSELDISSGCMGAMLRVVRDLSQLKEWALAFLDASAKPSSGILRGTTTFLGAYEECLDISIDRRGERTNVKKNEMFHGRYCTFVIYPPSEIVRAVKEYYYTNPVNRSHLFLAKTKTVLKYFQNIAGGINLAAFHYGVCVPSLCTEADFREIIKLGEKAFGFVTELSHCEDKTEFHTTIDQKIFIALFCVFFVFSGIGTSFDLLLSIKRSNKDKEVVKSHGKLAQFVLSFSFYSNTKRVVQAPKIVDDSPLRLIPGIVVFCVTVNMLGMVYFNYHPFYLNHYGEVMNLADSFRNFLFNCFSNLTPAFNIYFFLFGVTISYNRWKNKEHLKVKLIDLIVRPFFRLLSLQILVIGTFLLSPLFGSGPLWHQFMDRSLNNCRKYWWTNLLFISNFLTSYDICLFHTWIISAFMQCFLLCAVVLWIWSRKSVLGLPVNCMCIAGSVIAISVITYLYRLPGSTTLSALNDRTVTLQMDYIFIKPYHYVSGICLGLMMGYFLAKHLDSFKMSRCTSILGWISVSALLWAAAGGLYHHRSIEFPVQDKISAVIYAPFASLMWPLSVAWLLVASAKGYGGVLASFFGWKQFVSFYRLIPLVYSAHLPLLYFHAGTLREREYMDLQTHIVLFFALLCASYIVAFFGYVIFQIPFMYVESMICKDTDNQPLVPSQPKPSGKIQIVTVDSQSSVSDITSSPGKDSSTIDMMSHM